MGPLVCHQGNQHTHFIVLKKSYKGAERMFEELMTEGFPDLVKDIKYKHLRISENSTWDEIKDNHT